MKIGLIKCTIDDVIALVPKVVSKLIGDGFEVTVESGAGKKAGYADNEFTDAGAKLGTRTDILAGSDILFTVSGISESELAGIKSGAYLVGKFNADDTVKKVQPYDFHTFSLDKLPRSSFAQSMDVLSSLASLSGYKASVMAADHFSGYFPMMTTSAGTIPPAKVLVLGAGVAGLQAIATAKRLGAVVQAFDVRSSVKEEVESLGAKFIEVEGSAESEAAGGYAIEQTEDYIQKQKKLIHDACLKADVVITTAAIPGKKAPVLIEEETVKSMKNGSIIVDLAASTGGNCNMTKNNEIIDVDGVTIIGDSSLYNQLANQASLVFANNVYSFTKFVFKEGLDNIPFDNDVVSKSIIASDKESLITA